MIEVFLTIENSPLKNRAMVERIRAINVLYWSKIYWLLSKRSNVFLTKIEYNEAKKDEIIPRKIALEGMLPSPSIPKKKPKTTPIHAKRAWNDVFSRRIKKVKRNANNIERERTIWYVDIEEYLRQ